MSGAAAVVLASYTRGVRPKAELTPDNVRAFLARPWQALAKLKGDHWEQADAADPLSAFRASAELWELLHESGHTADPSLREADFASHLKLRALLDRTANVRPPR